MDVGKKIRNIRIHRGMTQKELGEKLGGVSQQQIGRWENGKVNPKINTIQKIATALNVNINELLQSPLDDSPLYRVAEENDRLDSPFWKDFFNSKLTRQVDNWQQIDIELIKAFKKLNESGKAIAIERVTELTEISRYTNNPEQSSDNENK